MTATLLIALLIVKLLTLAKYLTNLGDIKARKDAVTLVSAMVVGVVVVILAAHAAITEAVVIPPSTIPLGLLDWPSQVFLGLVATSLGAFAYDVKKAIDGSDSAREPHLFGPPAGGGDRGATP